MIRRRAVVLPSSSVVTYTDFHYTVSANNANFFTDAGSPGSGNYNIIVDSGVILGSTSTGTAAAVTGVFPGLLKVTVTGRIQGKGGLGGNGQIQSGKVNGCGGGGGGGAGTEVGAGGTASPNGVNGSVGTATAGGAGGARGSYGSGTSPTAATDGAVGGPALSLSMAASVDAGEIWGGGGGGGGGPDLISPGGNGGGPGTDGAAGDATGGVAGKAVALNGNAITWIAQTDVRGVVS